jgi:hypothetical protein
MGVYDLQMGKGVFISAEIFVMKYTNQINDYVNNYKEKSRSLECREIFSYIVKTYIDPKCEVYPLGHDAFEARHGNVFDFIEFPNDEEKKDRIDACKSIKLMIDESKSNQISDKMNDQIDGEMSDILFIGCTENICEDFELGYYVKAPEIIYTMSAMIPNIIKYHPILKDIKFDNLEEVFSQPPCIWIFSTDCCCCG